MRIWTWCSLLVVAALLQTGCASRRGTAAAQPNKKARTQQRLPTPDKPVVRLADDLTGRVQRVNPNGRFAVITFPVGQLPRFEQRLSVYRQDLKVGEIKITGPQLDDSVVADIIAGECAEGDTVRQ